VNLTIPIRAQNSTTSWTRGTRGNFSGKYTRKYNGADNKRYIFSLITVALLVSTLVVGSVGGIVQMASARDNYSRRGQGQYYQSQNTNSSRNDNNTNTAKPATTTPAVTASPSKTTTNTAPTTTAKPAVTAPAVAATTPAPAAVAEKAAVTPQIVSQPAVVEAPKPVDTAPQVASTAAAQATTDSTKAQEVTYTSQRLSDASRDRILIMAVVAATTAALLYTMSLFGAAEPKRAAIPVRYIVPVREASTS